MTTSSVSDVLVGLGRVPPVAGCRPNVRACVQRKGDVACIPLLPIGYKNCPKLFRVVSPRPPARTHPTTLATLGSAGLARCRRQIRQVPRMYNRYINASTPPFPFFRACCPRLIKATPFIPSPLPPAPFSRVHPVPPFRLRALCLSLLVLRTPPLPAQSGGRSRSCSRKTPTSTTMAWPVCARRCWVSAKRASSPYRPTSGQKDLRRTLPGAV